jgi:hypothetical protein
MPLLDARPGAESREPRVRRCMLSCSGVKVSCPGKRGAEGQGKRKGTTVRWGLKEARNERAGRGTRTGYKVWFSRGEAGTQPRSPPSTSGLGFINPVSMHGRYDSLPREASPVPRDVAGHGNWLRAA